jgi:exopolysaccharide biosynthesis polyprenyl glycosylphosphotransferase
MATSSFIVVFWVLSTVMMVATRLAIWYFLQAVRRQGRNLRHILIIGSNPRAIAFADCLSSKSELGYRILGFVDNDWPGLDEFRRTKQTLSCDFDELAEFLRQNVVDEVAMYLPMRSFYNRTSRVVALCEQHGIALRFDPDVFNLKVARYQAVDVEGRPHITARIYCPDGWGGLVKRVIDIAVSTLLLGLLGPFFTLVAVVIKMTSEGPVFFLQERVGFNKRKFKIYKFRTMVVNAEKMLVDLEKFNEVTGPVFKIKKDPRMTSVGSFLRRTSIDELPQLLNVLKGDMSLVGPRPLPVRDYKGFSEDWQRRRFSIRPGITCLWQVTGRSSISFDQWMKLDLQYMDEWSLWLDLKILARTIPAVLKGSGAA